VVPAPAAALSDRRRAGLVKARAARASKRAAAAAAA
jgi:hypothetical protein